MLSAPDPTLPEASHPGRSASVRPLRRRARDRRPGRAVPLHGLRGLRLSLVLGRRRWHLPELWRPVRAGCAAGRRAGGRRGRCDGRSGGGGWPCGRERVGDGRPSTGHPGAAGDRDARRRPRPAGSRLRCPLGSTVGSIEATPTPALAVIPSDASNPTGPPSSAPSGDAIRPGHRHCVIAPPQLPEVRRHPMVPPPGPPAVTPTRHRLPPRRRHPCPRPGRPRGGRPPLTRCRAASVPNRSDRPSRRHDRLDRRRVHRGVAPDARSQRGDRHEPGPIGRRMSRTVHDRHRRGPAIAH